MNITDNLIRIKEGKDNIIQSLKNKGVSINDNTLINEIPTIIDNAEIGGGGGDTPIQPDIPELVQKYEGASVFRIEVPNDNYDVFLTLQGYNNSNLSGSKFNIDWGDSTDIEELPLEDVSYHKYKYKGYYDINVFNLSDKYTLLKGGSEVRDTNNRIYSNIFDNPFNNQQYTTYDSYSGGRFNSNQKGITVVNDDICTSIILDYPITQIGEYAFQYCKSLKNIILPNSLTSIDKYAFQYCSSLTSIIIPEGVTTIPENLFYGCSSLTSVVIPNSVTSIGINAFYGCSSLTSVVIPNSVTSIGNNAFYGCSSLETINIPSGIKRIENSTFDECTSLTSVVINEGVTYLGSYNFRKCKSLTSVSLPSTLKTIDRDCFRECSSLETIIIPEGVTNINANVCYDCANLKTVILPNTLTSLGSSAFNYSYSIKTISIPNSLTTYSPFNELPLIEHIIINKEVAPNFYTQKMNLLASKKYVYVPDNSSGYNEGYWESNGFEVKSKNQIPDNIYLNRPTELKYTTINNIPITFKNLCLQTLVNQIQNENNEFIATFVDTIYKIPSYQFNKNIFLESIVIPEEVTSIDSSVFSNCKNLKNITLPNTLIEMKTTFVNCTSLTSVVIPKGVTSLPSNMFVNCTSLTSVVIPKGVTSLPSNMFVNCISLQSITCKAMQAPTIQSSTFQSIATSGTRVLRVPEGAEGYDSGYWKSSLLDKGYTLEYVPLSEL